MAGVERCAATTAASRICRSPRRSWTPPGPWCAPCKTTRSAAARSSYDYVYFSWVDALDDADNQVPDGDYTFRAEVTNTYGTSTYDTPVIVDTRVPGAITTPEPGGVLAGFAPVVFQPTAGFEGVESVDLWLAGTGFGIYNVSDGRRLAHRLPDRRVPRRRSRTAVAGPVAGHIRTTPLLLRRPDRGGDRPRGRPTGRPRRADRGGGATRGRAQHRRLRRARASARRHDPLGRRHRGIPGDGGPVPDRRPRPTPSTTPAPTRCSCRHPTARAATTPPPSRWWRPDCPTPPHRWTSPSTR